jgi:hypothetical protein
MAISRSQLVKELEPGLNALFGLEYSRYDNEHAEIFDAESSDRAFEEEVMLAGFATAPTKQEGEGVSFDTANETFTARYTPEPSAPNKVIIAKTFPPDTFIPAYSILGIYHLLNCIILCHVKQHTILIFYCLV